MQRDTKEVHYPLSPQKMLKISILQNKRPILHTKNVKLGVFIISNYLINTIHQKQ